MAFEIFRAVQPARATVFRFGQDDSAGFLRALIMFVDIVDKNQRPINHPGNL